MIHILESFENWLYWNELFVARLVGIGVVCGILFFFWKATGH